MSQLRLWLLISVGLGHHLQDTALDAISDLQPHASLPERVNLPQGLTLAITIMFQIPLEATESEYITIQIRPPAYDLV